MERLRRLMRGLQRSLKRGLKQRVRLLQHCYGPSVGFRHRPLRGHPRGFSFIAIALSSCLFATQAAAFDANRVNLPHTLETATKFAIAAAPQPQSDSAPQLLSSPAPILASSDAFAAGQASYSAGDYEEAIDWLNQAIAGYRQTGEQLPLAIALSNLSLAQQQLGNWPSATEALRESLQLLSQVQTDRGTQAAILDIQGNLQLSTGQTEAALQTWQRTESLYQQDQNEQGLVQSRINQAQALRILGFYGRARQRLNSVTELLPELSDQTTTLESKTIRAIQLRLLGDAQRLSGTVAEARETLNQSLKFAEEVGDRTTQAAVHLSLANAYRAQGNAETALQSYQDALEVAPNQNLRLKAQISQLSLLTQQNKIRPARQLLNELSPTIKMLPRHQAGLYSRIHLAQTLLDDSTHSLNFESSQLEQLLKESVAIATELRDRRSLSYAQGTLGHFYEQQDTLPGAIRLTQNALRNAQNIQAADIGYRWSWQLGRLLQRVGQIEDAIAAYDEAIADLDLLRSDLVSVNRDIQFSFRESVEPVYRESVGLLIQAETAKRNRVKPVQQQKQLTPSPEFQPAPIPGEQARSAQRKSNLEQARERIEALQLAELDNFFREACLDGKSVLLDKVVDQENPTTAIIYPIILDDRLEVIVKIPKNPELQFRTIKKPRAEIEGILQALGQDVRKLTKSRRIQRPASIIYDWLIRDFQDDIKASGVDTLVFVLDGPLRSIPMAVLFDGEKYLVEDYAVSVSLGLQLLEPKSLAKEDLNVLAAGLVTPPQDPIGFGPLPNIETEFQLIDETGVRNQQILNDDFTRQRLAKEVQQEGYNVVHLATHGQFSSNAEDTFILAADGRIKVTELDGLLRDRSQASSSAIEMLILSACETATGDDRAALGIAGVAIKAGARSTLASLWQVDDISTSVLMGEFYKQIASTEQTKAQALREAQLSLLQDADYQAPSYWAPYILVGNWL